MFVSLVTSRIRSYWHIIVALICLVLFFTTGEVAFKYAYRLLLAYGFLRLAFSLFFRSTPLLYDRVMALFLLVCGLLMLVFSAFELMGFRGVLLPEWIWLVVRSVIDPLYYIGLPLLTRKRRAAKDGA